ISVYYGCAIFVGDFEISERIYLECLPYVRRVKRSDEGTPITINETSHGLSCFSTQALVTVQDCNKGLGLTLWFSNGDQQLLNRFSGSGILNLLIEHFQCVKVMKELAFCLC